MQASTTAKHDEATKRLLEEGARSYLKATAALMVYEQEVQKRCREVLENHLDEYGEALGIRPSLSKSEIKPGVWKPELGAEWRCVGVHLVRRRVPPGIRYWATYCTLYWDDQDPGFYCNVGDYLSPRSRAEELFERFQKLNAAVEIEGKDLGLFQELAAGDVATFGERLESVLLQWIKLWKRVGGLKGAFKG
jgi:hypothetical protein